MEDYPHSYVAVPRPLIVLSGFDASHRSLYHDNFKARGRKISSESSCVGGQLSEKLLNEFLSYDGEDVLASGRPLPKNAKTMPFRVKAVGRDYILPRRKARTSMYSASPPASPPADSQSPGRSPLSPRCPNSTLYPDGVMTPLWPEKHQEILPSVFVSLFSLNSESDRDTLNDNLLKSEINTIKTTLAESQHRTRYAVILLGTDAVRGATDLEERLENIRRSAKLDNQSCFHFLHPETSDAELTIFVQTVLTALRPVCAEYYGELAKHARRKRDKSHSPPASPNATTGFVQSLRPAGWSARYSYKLGIFSEFRRETDAAIKNYGSALTMILNYGGLFESLSSWSPRWNEARMFADAVAIRRIRCLLANGQPSAAVQAWNAHRVAMKTVVERSGKSLASYGWEAWEARFAKVMAELVQSSADFAIDSNAQKATEGVSSIGRYIYAGIEKSFTNDEQYRPWYRLHHAGYWLLKSFKKTLARRALAQEIPEEDRVPPNQSPATRVAFRHETYDTYLVPEAHIEHASSVGYAERSQDIVRILQDAEAIFDVRNQLRMSIQLKLKAAQELIHVAKHAEALGILKPLWHLNSWRTAGWWTLAREISGNLYECAQVTHDNSAQVAVLWELMDSAFEPLPSVSYDLMSLMEIPISQNGSDHSKTVVHLSDENLISFLNISFSFRDPEGHAGEPVAAQLTMRSNAHSKCAPITLSSIKVEFEGAEPIVIHHDKDFLTDNESDHSDAIVENIELQDEIFHDLTFHPNLTRVLCFNVYFKEAAAVAATRVTAAITTVSYDLAYDSNLRITRKYPQPWWLSDQRGSRTIRGRLESSRINILPKPPKVQISLPNARDQYYANEKTSLIINIVNEETEEVDLNLNIEMFGQDEEEGTLIWLTEPSTELSEQTLQLHLGKLASGAKAINESLRFQAPPKAVSLKLAITALYHLATDPSTEITKAFSLDFGIVQPFETNFTVKTDLHPDPWPSFFDGDAVKADDQDSEGDSNKARGIVTRWSLKSNLSSVAADALVLERSELAIANVSSEAICKVSQNNDVSTIIPGCTHLVEFLLDVHKLELPESRQTTIESSLILHWRREDSSYSNDTVSLEIPVPRIALPSNEPRVLATARKTEGQDSITLGLVLENPTMHFLSFSVALESSDDFAFSGPKLKTIHLTPLTREMVYYSILPFVSGQYIYIRPRVFDVYFNKSLHIHSTRNLRSHQNGISMWIEEKG